MTKKAAFAAARTAGRAAARSSDGHQKPDHEYKSVRKRGRQSETLQPTILQDSSTAQAVSSLELKSAARKLLPAESMLRRLILLEPDTISREEAIVKIKMFSRMLDEEMR